MYEVCTKATVGRPVWERGPLPAKEVGQSMGRDAVEDNVVRNAQNKTEKGWGMAPW